MEERTREERGALFDSRGEGSDVICTSVILLSKSILCLFVFNILSPPNQGVFVCVCVCLLELRGWGAEEWGDERLTIRWHVSVWLASLQLTFWVFDYFLGGNAGINCCIFICVCVCGVGGLRRCIWYIKKISTLLFSFFRAPSNLSCSCQSFLLPWWRRGLH